MDCRKYREAHALLIDGKVAALEEFEMRSHMRYCEDCARHDAVVRRGLLMVRNLPPIEPSAHFRERLHARIQADVRHTARRRAIGTRIARYTAVAAMLSGITVAVGRAVRVGFDTDYRMPPVVASAPSVEPAFGTSGLVATVPTGMSIWPAIMMASQAPAHFATTESVAER